MLNNNKEQIISGATTAFIDSTNKSSVAFITLGGIEPLLLTFNELEERGVPGKVLTTDYNMFKKN